MAEAYLPLHAPFWSDGTFQVHERSEGHFTASYVNGCIHFQGSLRSCADWIERERERGQKVVG